MSEYSGVVVIGDKVATWSLIPASGGIIIEFDGFTLRLSREPSQERIMCCIEGFLQGYLKGKQDGRAILQNEFRNLMDCQP